MVSIFTQWQFHVVFYAPRFNTTEISDKKFLHLDGNLREIS